MLAVQKLFKETFGHTPTHTVNAPGRIELLGNHTDYNEGLVLAVAIDRRIGIASSPRTDGKIELISGSFPGREHFFLSNIQKNPATPWSDYIKGTLLQLRRQGIFFGGFNAAIQGDLPAGAGLSSSAALAVATALTVRQLHPYTITETGSTVPPKRNRRGQLRPLKPAERIHLARLCQRAENQFVGVNCGLLDPLASLNGRAYHALQIDCRHHSVEPVPMIGDISLVICHSGVKHEHAGGRYNELRRLCESAARTLGVRSLRAVDLRHLKAHRKKLGSREFDCAYHVIGETQRVLHAETALRDDDFGQFGEFMFQSHASSRDHLGNSSPELDLLVTLAADHPATLGARLTGGGFGGATINLVQRNKVELFMDYMALHYEKRTGTAMKPMLCQAVDGAQ